MENRNRQQIVICAVSYLGFREFEISLRRSIKQNNIIYNIGTFNRQDATKIIEKFFQAFQFMGNEVDVQINEERYSKLLSLELLWLRAGENY